MKLTITPESFPKHHWPAEKPQLKLNRFAGILSIAVNLFNGFAIYPLTIYYLLPFELVLPGNLISRFTLFLLGFILAIYLAILICEGSQLLVGTLIGYRAALLQVGQFAIVRTATGWRLRRVSHEILLLGGINYSGPLTNKHLRLRHTIYVTSGYLITALLWYMLLNVDMLLSVDHTPGWLVVLLDLLVIATTFILSHKLLYVVKELGISLFRHPNHFQQLQLIRFTTLSASGVRPRDIDPLEIATFIADTEGTSLESSAQLHAYEHAVDSGKLEEATHALNQALQALHYCLNEVTRVSVMLAAAEYEVTYNQNLQSARDWLERCQLQETSPLAYELSLDYLQVKTAILLAEGELQAARSAALEGQKMLKNIIDLGCIPSATEKLNDVLQKTEHIVVFQSQRTIQPIRTSKGSLPLQPKVYMMRSVCAWLLFASIYFLMIHTNLATGSLAVIHIYWGDQYASTGQYQQAIVEYTKADAAMPDGTYALWARGRSYRASGDYAKAIADFDRVIALTVFENMQLYLTRGATYQEWGNDAAAEADFDHALSLAERLGEQQEAIQRIQEIRATRQAVEE